MAQKFYICTHCGNVITKLTDSGVPVVCCGEQMAELIAGTTDAAKEKHVPVVKIDETEVHVSVGSVVHPMTKEHFIEWVMLKTQSGSQIKHLKPNENPEVVFSKFAGDEVKGVYAYCNLHGLWKA